MQSTAFSLIGELEEAIARGKSDTRVNTLRRITDLFVGQAIPPSGGPLELFDEVIGRLAADIEVKARAELSRRLAPLAVAPANVVKMLASDENIEVAQPILTNSEQLDEPTLVEVAKQRGQQHLLAISQRRVVTEAVTDVLVDRGNPTVLRTVAGNAGASFSDGGYSQLVNKAEDDDLLAFAVAGRKDIAPMHFAQIVARASEAVLLKLRATHPHLESQIAGVISEVTASLTPQNKSRDYSDAEDIVAPLHANGKLDGQAVGAFAKGGKFEETVVSLSLLCRLPVTAVEEIMLGEQRDTALILAKAADLSWPTAKAILTAHAPQVALSQHDLDKAEQNYRGLSTGTAQRVLRFFQVRLNTDKGSEKAS